MPRSLRCGQGRPAVLAFLMILPLALACGLGSDRKEDTLESAGREVSVTFPASARLLGVYREGDRGSWRAVKVEMPAADWPGFLAKLPVDPRLFRSGERGLLGPDDGFWDPHQAKRLQTAQGHLPAYKVLNIGYDDSKAGLVVVYVVSHGM